MLLAGGLFGLYGWNCLQTEQAAAERALEVKAKARVALAHAAAHELRQPLHAIVAMVGSLRTLDSDRSRSSKLGDRLEQSAKSLNKTLLNAIDVFDLWSGQCVIELEPVDLHTEITLIVRKKNKQFAEQGSDVKVLCGHLPDLWCELDPTRLHQVLEAVIDEAAYHTTDGRVRITCQVEQHQSQLHQLSLSVHASGLQVHDADASTLFAPDLYQDNKLLKGRPAAMMALNVAHQVASLMRGDIKVQSVPGSGTRFVLELPTVTCSPAHTTELDVDTPQVLIERALNPDFSALSVLLVDDNEMNLFVLQEMIYPMGFGRVICAGSGAEAIDRCSREPIDLILMDLVMPGIDGYEAAEKIRTEHSDCAPVILSVSAQICPEQSPDYQKAGFRTALQKPLSPSDLFTALMDVAPSLLINAEARKRAKRSPATLRLASG